MCKKNKEGVYTKNFSVNHCTGISDDPEFHLHDNIEIYLSISGGDKFIINDKMYDINKMDIFVIGNHDIHKATCLNNVPYERYYMQFNMDFLSRYNTSKTNLTQCFNDFFNNSINRIHLTKEQNQDLITLFNKVLNINTSIGKDLLEQIYFVEIILYISQLFYQNENLSLDYYLKDGIPVLKKLFDYINKNISEDLNLDVLANEIYVSKSYMCKVFKDNTGTTINKYIIARRIAEAKKLLMLHDNVMYVCHKSGFNNYSNFIRTFTNKVGISPMKYAKKFK